MLQLKFLCSQTLARNLIISTRTGFETLVPLQTALYEAQGPAVRQKTTLDNVWIKSLCPVDDYDIATGETLLWISLTVPIKVNGLLAVLDRLRVPCVESSMILCDAKGEMLDGRRRFMQQPGNASEVGKAPRDWLITEARLAARDLEIERQKSRVQKKEDQRLHALLDNAALRARVAELEAAAGAEGELGALRAELEKLRAEVGEKDRRMAKVREQRAGEQREIGELSVRVVGLQRQNAELASGRTALGAELEALRAELGALKAAPAVGSKRARTEEDWRAESEIVRMLAQQLGRESENTRNAYEDTRKAHDDMQRLRDSVDDRVRQATHDARADLLAERKERGKAEKKFSMTSGRLRTATRLLLRLQRARDEQLPRVRAAMMHNLQAFLRTNVAVDWDGVGEMLGDDEDV